MVLSERVTLVCGEPVILDGALVILGQAQMVFIHAAELILSGSKALRSGLAVPGQSLCVVERDVAGVERIVAEGKLSLCVAGGGGDEKRVGVFIERRSWLLGRGRQGCLCSRDGSER